MRAPADAHSLVPARAHAQHAHAHASTRCTRMQVRTHGYMDTHAYMHTQDNDLSLCDGRGYICSHSGSVLASHVVTFLSSIAPIAAIPDRFLSPSSWNTDSLAHCSSISSASDAARLLWPEPVSLGRSDAEMRCLSPGRSDAEMRCLSPSLLL